MTDKREIAPGQIWEDKEGKYHASGCRMVYVIGSREPDDEEWVLYCWQDGSLGAYKVELDSEYINKTFEYKGSLNFLL